MLTDKDLLLQLSKEFDLFKKETAKVIGDLQRESASLKERLAKYEIFPILSPYIRKSKILNAEYFLTSEYVGGTDFSIVRRQIKLNFSA